MRRFLILLVPLVLAKMVAAGPPQRLADRQLAFAEKLHADGEKAFALLEYKRFLFQQSDHPRAIEAALAAARLYVGYLEDLDGAKRTLTELAAKYPRTDVAKRAKQFVAFVEVNSDYQGKPLALFVTGTDEESRGRYSEAAASYATVAGKYPKAQLADDALLLLGKVRLERLHQAPQAAEAFGQLLRQHPRSEHVADASYHYAVALEKQHGPTMQVVAEYRRVAKAYPNTDAARLAAARLAEMEKARHVLRRQYDRASVQPYTVLREGYQHAKDQYAVRIKVAAVLSERQMKATLEDALLAHYGKRARASHAVHVTAYAKYPGDQVGSVSWSPNQPPYYHVPRPTHKGDDVLKDVLIDILRKI